MSANNLTPPSTFMLLLPWIWAELWLLWPRESGGSNITKFWGQALRMPGNFSLFCEFFGILSSHGRGPATLMERSHRRHGEERPWDELQPKRVAQLSQMLGDPPGDSSICLTTMSQETPSKTSQRGTSLVAQWLRIHLPMQGTWVRALVQEDFTCRGATKPVCHDYWACAPRAHALQQEKPRTATKSSPGSLQLDKAACSTATKTQCSHK